MTPSHETPSAKEQVISWVRSKNPQTMELKMGCKVLWDDYEFVIVGIGRANMKNMYQLSYADGRGVHEHEVEDENGTVVAQNAAVYVDAPWQEILGSDMGLQELLIAFHVKDENGTMYNDEQINTLKFVSLFDLTKNLHNQDDSFYAALLPLIK